MSLIWNDVRFDPLATDELVRQLVMTATAVEEAAAVLSADGGSMDTDWIGPARAHFEAVLPDLLTTARSVADALLEVARAATAALAAAEGESRLRSRLRNEATLAAACAVGQAC